MTRFLIPLLFSASCWGYTVQKYVALGLSANKQFVALETYGYNSHDKSSYATITILDVWSRKYVGTPVEVTVPGVGEQVLVKAREGAKQRASSELSKFKISH